MSPSHVLELEQIVQLFPRSFVLLDHCKFSPRRRLTHGHVVCTSPTSGDVYRALRETPNSLIIFTGAKADAAEDALLDRDEEWDAGTANF